MLLLLWCARGQRRGDTQQQDAHSPRLVLEGGAAGFAAPPGLLVCRHSLAGCWLSPEQVSGMIACGDVVAAVLTRRSLRQLPVRALTSFACTSVSTKPSVWLVLFRRMIKHHRTSSSAISPVLARSGDSSRRA